MMRVLTFGIDNRALVEKDCHSLIWNKRMGNYVEQLDVLVEAKDKRFREKWIANNVRIIPIFVPNQILYPVLAYRWALRLHKKRAYNLTTIEAPFRTTLAAVLFKLQTGVPISMEYPTDTINNKRWIRERTLINTFYNSPSQNSQHIVYR